MAPSNREFPLPLKACMTRSLEGWNDDLACDDKSPHFRYVPPEKLGFMRFLNSLTQP